MQLISSKINTTVAEKQHNKYQLGQEAWWWRQFLLWVSWYQFGLRMKALRLVKVKGGRECSNVAVLCVEEEDLMFGEWPQDIYLSFFILSSFYTICFLLLCCSSSSLFSYLYIYFVHSFLTSISLFSMSLNFVLKGQHFIFLLLCYYSSSLFIFSQNFSIIPFSVCHFFYRFLCPVRDSF